MVLAETRRSRSSRRSYFNGFCQSLLSAISASLRDTFRLRRLRITRPLPEAFLALLRSSIVATSNSRGDQPCRSEVFCAG
jgi:hypothetical protein